MNHIYYLNALKAEELWSEPYRGWDLYDPSKLLIIKKDNNTPEMNIENIICYSSKHLLILVKSSQENIVDRDRSYQNGDGFHFVLAKPNEDNSPSDEFYVIGISPLQTSWRRKFIWYKDVDLCMKELINSSVKHISYNNEIYFGVRIPWDEITPIKPFLFKNYGFNISYVQGGDVGSNVYILKEDEYIQSEQSLRDYVIYDFQDPESSGDLEYSVDLNRKNCNSQEDLYMKMAVNTPRDEVVELKVLIGEKIVNKEAMKLSMGINIIEVPILTSSLNEGEHDIDVYLKGCKIDIKDKLEFYFYRKISLDILRDRIHRLENMNVKNFLLIESTISLKFLLEDITQKIESLKPYDDFDDISKLKKDLEMKISHVECGNHIFQKGEVIRLGFKSQFDDSLQPYSLYIPDTIGDSSDLRLLVYLHGSGSDDRSIGNSKPLLKFAEEHNTILLAPFARGTSHFYCPQEARRDINELTKKAIALFGINRKNVFLGGFSMGGYGTYRVYDDMSYLFNGLIVISGHHSMGTYHGGPDYSDSSKIVIFSDIPMIIFHGTEDHNCSYQEFKEFLSIIKDANPQCRVHIKEGRGHSGLTEDWYLLLSKWLDEIS